MEVINEKQKKIIINFILYFITFVFVCLYGIRHSLAYTYENIGYLNNNSQVQVVVSYNDQPLTIAKDQYVQLRDVYSLDINISNINLSPSSIYQFEIYTPDTVLTRANSATVINTSGNTPVSCTVLSTQFTNDYPQLRFQCSGSTNLTSLYISFYNSQNQSLFDARIFHWSYTYMRRQIDSGSDNTGQIIDNQNQNTQDIINNQNQNTQDIINSQYTCSNTSINLNKYIEYKDSYLKTDGDVGSTSNFSVTQYIKIKNNSDYNIILNYSTNNRYCFYDKDLNFISCSTYGSSRDIDFTSPSNASFVRFTIRTGDTTNLTSLNGSICLKDSQIQSNAINNLDDTLNDDDTDGATDEASDFFQSFTTETFGLTSIITAPLNLIQSLLSTGAVCNNLRLPLPYLNNKYLELPCMYIIYRDNFGSLFTMYQTITYGIIAYWVCVRIFNLVKDFKNPEHDEIEVLDL